MERVAWRSHPSLWRRRWHHSHDIGRRLRQPVISVGNLSMGGRGKTPLVAHLAARLLRAGERPAILSRGYARRRADDGIVVVSDGRHLLADLDRSGDEPLMLARAVPGAAVLVSRDRALAGRLAERHLGATVHLLDDGFQHFMLRRDLDLVVVTNEDLTDRPAPFGRLREPVAALADADAVVLDGDVDPARVSSVAPGAELFRLRRAVGPPEPLEPARAPTDPNRPVVALAGIVRPERVVTSLEREGWTVARLMAFRDHHRYSSRDVAAIGAAVEAAGAGMVLTTAKDAVRLLPLRPLPFAVGVVPLEVVLEPEAAFGNWLAERVRQARP